MVMVLYLFTVKGGFFDGIVFSFRRFNHVMFKRNDYLESWKEKPLPSEKFNKETYKVFTIQCGSLLIILILLLTIYYI